MNRRCLLLLCGSTAFTAGCLGQEEMPNASTESATTTSSATVTETASSTSTDSPSPTPTGPHTFAYIINYDDTTHRGELTITQKETESVVFTIERQIEPGDENAVQINDEWLTEEGTYRVDFKTEQDKQLNVEIEADTSWACNNVLGIEIEQNGELTSYVQHGDGKQQC